MTEGGFAARAQSAGDKHENQQAQGGDAQQQKQGKGQGGKK